MDSLFVDTPFGTAYDVGTRFAVRLAGDGLEVLVRDGEVRVADETRDREWSAHAGEGLHRPGPASDVERFDVQAWDARWDWTRALASFDAVDAPTADYLAWLSREHGWTLRYADDQSRARALEPGGRVLDGLTAEESLDAMLRVAELAWRIDDGELVVSLAD